MKKNRITSALLALALIITAAPIHAAEEISFEEKSTLSVVAQEEPAQQKLSFKEKAKKQFNESLNRFRRCMKGKCDRWEEIKTARDLGIAAVTVIAGLYVGRKGIQTGLQVNEKVQRVKKEIQRKLQKQTAPTPGLHRIRTPDGITLARVIQIHFFGKHLVVRYFSDGEEKAVPLSEWKKMAIKR